MPRKDRALTALIEAEDPERPAEQGSSFTEAYQRFRRDFDLTELQVDLSEVFDNTRDSSPGRDFNLRKLTEHAKP